MTIAEQLIDAVVGGDQPSDVLSLAEEDIRKFPPKTEIHDWEKFSLWNGKLAMVFSPSYTISHSSSETDFDPAKMARVYRVRYAIDMDKKHITDRTLVGKPYYITDSKAPFHKTTWRSSDRPSGYGVVQMGSFEPKEHEYWVKLKVKELWPGESLAMVRYLEDNGYLEVDYETKYRLGQKTWKQILSKDFMATQGGDSKVANAAYDLVSRKLGHGGSEEQESAYWKSIKGVYAATKKGAYKWHVSK